MERLTKNKINSFMPCFNKNNKMYKKFIFSSLCCRVGVSLCLLL